MISLTLVILMVYFSFLLQGRNARGDYKFSMGVIEKDLGSQDDGFSQPQMDITLSNNSSLHDTLELEDSLGNKEQIGDPSSSSNFNSNVEKKRKNSAQAFSSFSYTNYWQLGELGSRNNDS
jgi:hypothetical protein